MPGERDLIQAATTKVFISYSHRIKNAKLRYFSATNKYNSTFKQPVSSLKTLDKLAPDHWLLIIDSFDEVGITSNSGKSLEEPVNEIILQRYVSLLEHALNKILKLTKLLKWLTALAIRLQFIANAIRNRTSRSPTPQKKEPPIGGIKVGGEAADSHVAGKLYPIIIPYFNISDALVAQRR